MNNFRLILVVPLLIPLFIGVLIVFLFGIPFVIIGGKPGMRMFNVITKMISD